MNSSRPRTRWAGPLAVGLLALAAPTGTDPAGAITVPVTPAFVPVPAASPVREDFDGDGYEDLAVADPRATVDGRHGAGRVTVFYGGPDGRSSGASPRRAVISRATGGVPGGPVAGDGFGTRLSQGDLDADGYADLVVGTAGGSDAVIVWGGPHGLSGAASVPAATGETGDFDGDGLLDLALFRPAPGSDHGTSAATTAAVWTGPVRRTGVPARAAPLDPGGLADVDVAGSAAGDVDGDGRDDLVLSVRHGTGDFHAYVYRSTAAGPVRAAGHRGGPGVAVRDLDGDGYADIVVGTDPDPGTGTGTGTGAGPGGRIDVAYGSGAGVGEGTPWKTVPAEPPTPRPAAPRSPASKTPASKAPASGPPALVLDTDGDGCADLAVFAPGERAGDRTFRAVSGCADGTRGKDFQDGVETGVPRSTHR
ncbi:VCBS repeat-containing protein [Streptomyces sp. NPDC007084]|uniref:FG-GAP repeat domain-containing protein n=1 Tax=Streptomyces sp. NPDC007084 TaxID=3154313 RepID=UPI003456C663